MLEVVVRERLASNEQLDAGFLEILGQFNVRVVHSVFLLVFPLI